MYLQKETLVNSTYHYDYLFTYSNDSSTDFQNNCKTGYQQKVSLKQIFKIYSINQRDVQEQKCFLKSLVHFREFL